MTAAAEFPVWVNGAAVANPNANSRGLAYGDGLFETFLVRQGAPLLVEEHWQRFAEGCRRLALQPDVDKLQKDLAAYCDSLEGAWHSVKVLCERQATGRGYMPATQECTLMFSAAAATAPDSARQWTQGISIAQLDYRCGSNAALAGIKHLNRLDQVLASAEVAQRKLDEGIVCDAVGDIAGCVAASLFLRRGERLLLASNPGCGVDGTMAAYICGLAEASVGIRVEKKLVSGADIACADELFCCNALRGIWPVVALEGNPKPIGDMTRTLQSNLSHSLYGPLRNV